MFCNIHNKRGFSLIELLIVILIAAVLAAIAIPMYTNYGVRARRSDAKVALEQVRAAQEMWRAERGTYAADGGGSSAEVIVRNTMGAPASSIGSGYYTWSFIVKTPNSFTAEAQPVAGGPQAGDGSLFINNRGRKWDSDGKFYPEGKWAK